MSQKDIDALSELRTTLVSDRRMAAAEGDADAVVGLQTKIDVVDAAIADEQALGQHEKDEVAITRAMKAVPDGSNVEEISLLADPIRVSD
jgi:hypothetical protein